MWKRRSTTAIFPIVVVSIVITKHSLTKSAVKVDGTSLCLEPFQQLEMERH
jgi:hypothetical protein